MDRWRSSTDEVASTVQKVTAALFTLLYVAIKKKKNKSKKDIILKKEEEEEEKGSPCIPPCPPRLIAVCYIQLLILRPPPC